jgi:RimJ/RimL family protein N-acetyltransferase
MKLETQRLILREPKISDWKDIVEGIGNFNVTKTMSSVPYPYKKKDAFWWITKSIKEKNKKSRENYSFVIELKSKKKIIGGIGLHHIDFNKTAETGSWIAQPYWRKGYITEAKIALNEFAFNKLKLRKLHSPIFSTNMASNATQKRMGYKLEGVLKKEKFCKATKKVHDVNICGLFKEDWKKNLPSIKKHLQMKIKKLEDKHL